MSITRRQFITRTTASALILAAGSAVDLPLVGEALAQTRARLTLAQAGPLGDVVEGQSPTLR